MGLKDLSVNVLQELSRQQQRLNELTHARWPQPCRDGVIDLSELNINSHIANLEIAAGSQLMIAAGLAKSHQDCVVIYVYLRDELGAKTYGRALDMIGDRRIAPEVVRAWVEQGRCLGDQEAHFVKKGYPELSIEVDANTSDFFRGIW